MTGQDESEREILRERVDDRDTDDLTSTGKGTAVS
jgi:hypothetical protein